MGARIPPAGQGPSGEDGHKLYVAFKDDSFRFKALVSRDLRIVLIVAMCLIAAVLYDKWPRLMSVIAFVYKMIP